MSGERAVGGARSGAVLLDPGVRIVRTSGGRISWRLHRRTAIVCGVLVLIIIGASLATLAIGTYQLSLWQVLEALTGRGDERAMKLVVEWRLPRLLFAICCGIALAIGGAIFQSITRNPLGSPDVIGFDAGAYSGALIVMLVIGSGSYAMIAAGSIVGGLVTAGVVYLLAYRGGVEGFRLIIMGIGVGALLASFNTMLLISSGLEQAMLASAWGAGSLNALGFAHFVPFALILLVLLPVVGFVAPRLSQLELGDDAARALGIEAERTRLLATVSGVACTALVTAAAGPIAFVALVSPQIAHRLTRSAGLGLLPASLVGALLLVLADFVAQRIGLPVGIVTVSVGGCYLIWLLVRQYRAAA